MGPRLVLPPYGELTIKKKTAYWTSQNNRHVKNKTTKNKKFVNSSLAQLLLPTTWWSHLLDWALLPQGRQWQTSLLHSCSKSAMAAARIPRKPMSQAMTNLRKLETERSLNVFGPCPLLYVFLVFALRPLLFLLFVAVWSFLFCCVLLSVISQ